MMVGVDKAWSNDLIRSINNIDLPTRKVYVGFGLDEGFVAVFRESHDSTIAYGFGLV